MARSNAWKAAEKQWAAFLCQFKLTAVRRSRAGNWSQSTDDVAVEELPFTINDTKYSVKAWKSNRLLEECHAKYFKNVGDSTILVTKGYKEVGLCATVDGRFLAMLLAFWAGVGTKEELWSIYTKQSSKETKDESQV